MKKKKTILITLIIMLVLVSFSAIFYKPINKRAQSVLLSFNVVSGADNLLVHYISVGQGDAIAINLPDNKVMLIDTGDTTKSANSACVNYLKENVFNTAKTNKIDYLVLSHADADHIGGALTVLKNFEVGTIFMPNVESNSQTYKNLCQHIADNNIHATTDYSGLVIDNGSYQIQVFGPLNFTDTNDSCAVIKISYAGFSFLFTGDIEATVDGEFVDKYKQELDCNVLKVAHHGSSGASSAKFLACVTPEYAVISCGTGNRYNHPHQEALDRLNDVGAKTYRTDLLGNIMFVAGADYGLAELDGDYTIIGFKFNYLYIVIIVDSLLALNIVIVAVSKPKRDKTKKHK